MVQNTIIGDEALDTVLLGERTFGWGTSFPSTWHEDGFFIRTDESKLYQNTGTEATPVWTEALDTVNPVWAFMLGD